MPVDSVALNADVVGYSRLVADDADATSKAMTAAHVIVERVVDERGGALANFVGDNFMAVFGDAREAIGAAIEITRTLEARNEGVRSDRWLRFRMGLDQGSIATTDGRYEGETLNVAARIQAIAPAGGIAVTGRVYGALDEPALRFRATGRPRLKNIPDTVEVYEFVGLPTDAGPTAPSSDLSLDEPTLAILPVIVDEASEAAATVAVVLRSDLLHRLGSIPDLDVVDAARLAAGDAEHAARYMLETGVHQFGDVLRVYATLFDVTTMNVVKSHKEIASPSEILEMSDGLADAVGQSIEVELVVGAPAGLYHELDDPAAIEDVYLGWYHLRSGTREGWVRALELFERVAERRPDMSYGFVLAAFTNWIGVASDWVDDPEGVLLTARDQAARGKKAGDPTGMAMAVDSAVLMSLGRIEEATEAMEQLEISRPTCDVTYGLEGSVKRYLGRWEEAVQLIDHAMSLTGVNKPWYPTVKACSLFVGEKVDQAAAVAESVLEYQPKNLEALLVLAASQVELGLERRAAATADRIREEFPGVDAGTWLDRNPYQDPSIVERWKGDLAQVGLVASGS